MSLRCVLSQQAYQVDHQGHGQPAQQRGEEDRIGGVVRSVEATQRWMALVFLPLAYLQLRLREERSAPIQSLADVIQIHRAEHVHIIFRAACQMAQGTQDIATGTTRVFEDAA